MSDLPEGTPGSRTRYTITLSAREKGAIERFLGRKTVAGDVALVEDVLREILKKISTKQRAGE